MPARQEVPGQYASQRALDVAIKLVTGRVKDLELELKDVMGKVNDLSDAREALMELQTQKLSLTHTCSQDL